LLIDLDGVLVDSLRAWHEVVNDTRRHLGFEPIDEARLLGLFGQGVEDDVHNLYPGHATGEVRRLYDESMVRHIPSIRVGPETLEVLDWLGTRGLGRAVVTNTQRSLATAILRHTGIDRVVDAVAAAGGRAREKPHPDLLHETLAVLGTPASEAIMVGDTDYDAGAARAAGVRYVHFDLRVSPSLREALARHLDGAAPPTRGVRHGR
ncbi:MAG: HAD family hydrolase, partial [Planctomycetota bacterium]